MGLNTKYKAVKALYASGNAATRYSATQSIQTLSGSSYILSDVTRGNGVQTYNMKKELIMVQP
jgi:lipopolysaccharide export system protein LptA